ncbi:MAG: lipopolysaccharide heptosyltransferase II [Pseudomonadota bacterium]
MKRVIPKTIRRILLRSPNWVGDAILATPAIRAIRKYFPDSEISILAKPWVAPVFEQSPHVDHVLIYDASGIHKGLKGRLRLIRQIKREGFDLAVLFQNAFEAALIAFLGRIPIRIGYDTDGRGLLLTHRAKAVRGTKFKGVHEIYYYLGIITPFGIPEDGAHLTLNLDKEADYRGDKLLEKFGFNAKDKIVGISPGATYGSAKRWFAERFGALADKIYDCYGSSILIFGAPGESDIAEETKKAMHTPAVNLCGKTSLCEAMALIRRCCLFITNDSGLMHIASALDVPLIAIFGPTNSKTTGPVGAKSRIVQVAVECSPCLKPECPTDHRCMKDITVDMVFDALYRKALDENSDH